MDTNVPNSNEKNNIEKKYKEKVPLTLAIKSSAKGSSLKGSPSIGKKCLKVEEVKRVKCLLVGDSQVGKTALVHTFLFDRFHKDCYIPTARDDYTFCTTLGSSSGGGVDVDLDICDTGGQSSLDRLRPLCYGKAEVAIICFSVVIPSSLANVTSKWIPELKRHCLNYKSMKTILVGTQSDLRSNVNILLQLMDDGLAPISETRALRLAKKIGALKYLECSALNKYNVKKVFELAMTPTGPLGSPLVPSSPPPSSLILSKASTIAPGPLGDRKLFWRRWRLRQKSTKIKRLMFLSCLF